MRIRNLILTMLLAASLGLAACSGEDYAKTIEQGRCVGFGDGKVTFVRDVNVDPKKAAKYDNSVLTFELPKDPKEIGPEPAVGCLIAFDSEKNEVTVFKDNSLQSVKVEAVDVKKSVASHSSDVKGKKFPMVNKDKGEVTIYLNKCLATLKIPSGLPSDEAFWTAGDDVRVFTTEKGKARRFMNISKTNIFKK